MVHHLNPADVMIQGLQARLSRQDSSVLPLSLVDLRSSVTSLASEHSSFSLSSLASSRIMTCLSLPLFSSLVN